MKASKPSKTSSTVIAIELRLESSIISKKEAQSNGRILLNIGTMLKGH